MKIRLHPWASHRWIRVRVCPQRMSIASRATAARASAMLPGRMECHSWRGSPADHLTTGTTGSRDAEALTISSALRVGFRDSAAASKSSRMASRRSASCFRSLVSICAIVSEARRCDRSHRDDSAGVASRSSSPVGLAIRELTRLSELENDSPGAGGSGGIGTSWYLSTP